MSEAVDHLAKGFSDVVNAPLKAASSAYDTVTGAAKSLFGGGGSSKPDTSGHDQAVADANKTFVDKANATAAAKPKAPAAAKPAPLPKFHEGTDYVPKTGPAILKKGEAVLNNKDAAKHREAKMSKGTLASVSDELSGKAAKPKKEIKSMHIKKAANGGHIIRHEHTHPEHHPDEEHTTKTDDQLASHVLQNMGTPNPGEADADAGQSGAPAAGTPAPAPAAPNAAMPMGA
jgi:hypothetical protein